MTRASIRLAASGLVLALATVGCGPQGGPIASASSLPTGGDAAGLAGRAQKALAKNDLDGALRFAEAAVAADPHNPGNRAVLAQVYSAEGRFASAERTWMDVIQLGQVDARSVLGAAIAMTAQDKVGEARQLVDAHRDIIPTADYGLALALTGDSKAAVDVLGDAIRQDGADARTRQNLALAYALDGRWREARLMAAQDLPAPVVDSRINDWAAMARPGAYQLRVATLLGVTPRQDPGQPVALALNTIPADTRQAAAEPQRDPVALASADAQPLPAIGPAPLAPGATEPVPAPPPVQQVAATPAPMPAQFAIPASTAAMTAAAAQPPRVASAGAPARVAGPAAPQRTATLAHQVQPRAGGSHVVQLGAFSTMAGARSAWSLYSHRFAMLSDYSPATVPVTVQGRTLTRLAATGGMDRRDADALCRRVKASGGACFVRPVAPGSVQQAWNIRTDGRRLAAR